MYDPGKRQFVIRQSSGRLWNFYSDERNSLHYSILTKNRIWSEPILLHKGVRSFYADTSYDDRFHILFQDIQGNMLYSNIKGSSMRTVTLLKGKNPTPYNKHPWLTVSGGIVHCFYVIERNGSLLLIHHPVENGNPGVPKPVEHIARSEFPYSAVSGTGGDIHVFYHIYDGRHLQLGSMKYTGAAGTWEEFKQLTSGDSDSEFPKAIINNSGSMHLCYRKYQHRRYELVYRRYTPEKSLWTEETLLYSSPYSFIDASLLQVNQKLMVFWIREEGIYYTASNDLGTTWSKPSKYGVSSGKQFECITYKTTCPEELGRFASESIPGSSTNVFKLAFFDDFATGVETLQEEDLKTIFADTLRQLRFQMEELCGNVSKLREKTALLASNNQNLEKELTKNALRIEQMDTEIRKLKLLANEVDSCKKHINELENENFK